GGFTTGAIDWNRYRHNSGSSYEFIWNGTPYDSFANWKSGGAVSKDANSILSTVALGLITSAPSVTSPATDFALTSTSPARDTGDSAAVPFVPALGERDYAGQSRVANSRVDIGADEYMTSWQSWRDLYFGLPDGGTGANALDDADADKAVNLLEYSQGMNPVAADTALLPYASIVNGNYRIYYRKAAPELTYSVEQSASPTGGWVTLNNAEGSNGSGLYWRELPLSAARSFLRAVVTQP
ncbi:MAG: choice-of-anchor Q domain-containing protein, partial [Roseimicrobium sp.]